MKRPKPTSRRVKLAVIAASCVLGLFAAELILWLRAPRLGEPAPDADVVIYPLAYYDMAGERPLLSEPPPNSLKFLLDPHVAIRHAPNQRTRFFTINSRGYRGPEIGEKGERQRVVLIGGSTAFGQGLPAEEQTLGAQLEKRLPRVEMINAAVIGHNSADELSLLRRELFALEPDLVVAFDGFNDAVNSIPLVDAGLTLNMWFGAVDTQLREHYSVRHSLFSAVVAPLYVLFPRVMRLVEKATDPEVVRRKLAGDPPPEGAEQVYRDRATLYLRNLISMKEECDLRGVKLLVLLQAQRPTPWKHMEYFASLYDHFIATAEDGLAGRGIPVRNLHTDAELSAEHFYDDVHMRASGYELVAERIAAWIELNLPTPESD